MLLLTLCNFYYSSFSKLVGEAAHIRNAGFLCKTKEEEAPVYFTSIGDMSELQKGVGTSHDLMEGINCICKSAEEVLSKAYEIEL